MRCVWQAARVFSAKGAAYKTLLGFHCLFGPSQLRRLRPKQARENETITGTLRRGDAPPTASLALAILGRPVGASAAARQGCRAREGAAQRSPLATKAVCSVSLIVCLFLGRIRRIRRDSDDQTDQTDQDGSDGSDGSGRIGTDRTDRTDRRLDRSDRSDRSDQIVDSRREPADVLRRRR